MDEKKLDRRKYTRAYDLAKCEKEKLIKLYSEEGKSYKEIAELYYVTPKTIIKALVFCGYDGPQWAHDEVKRTIKNKSNPPSTMKRTTDGFV